MTIITETGALSDLCERLSTAEFICIDTEFMREGTYWPRLCLVQIAGPDGEGFAIDPLVDDLDLKPLLDLLLNKNVLKVFHAARQDIEIFFGLTGEIPIPLFDTQVASMVCGFGEAASYMTLARKLARAKIDKTSRFTDWSKRPLTDRQVAYALADVEHLPKIYRKLAHSLESAHRSDWVEEEMASLLSPETYIVEPRTAWKRIKTRETSPRFLALLCELVAVRETFAQERNIPRNRVVRDEALVEIAAHRPETKESLSRTRGLGKGAINGSLGAALLKAVRLGLAVPEKDCPHIDAPRSSPRGAAPLVDLLKVLLKMRCEENDVAQKLVANTAELEYMVSDDHAPVRALHGWRNEIFGHDAIALKHGKLALAARKGRIAVIDVADEPPG